MTQLRTIPIFSYSTYVNNGGEAQSYSSYLSACKAQETLLASKSSSEKLHKSSDKKRGNFVGFFSHYRYHLNKIFVCLIDIHDDKNKFLKATLEIEVILDPKINYFGKYKEEQKILFEAELLHTDEYLSEYEFNSPIIIGGGRNL